MANSSTAALYVRVTAAFAVAGSEQVKVAPPVYLIQDGSHISSGNFGEVNVRGRSRKHFGNQGLSRPPGPAQSGRKESVPIHQLLSMRETGYIHFAMVRSALADPAMEPQYSTSIELHLRKH